MIFGFRITNLTKKVSKDTISRWLKDILNKSGIDTTKFTAHSFRMAATSAASSQGVGISTILATANWANVKKTFTSIITERMSRLTIMRVMQKNRSSQQ